MKTIFLIILLSTTLSCKSQKEDWYSHLEICDCYSTSHNSNIDLKLNGCLEDRNQTLSKENLKDFEANYKAELTLLVKKLINTCPKYQADFNQIFLNKFATNDCNLISKKDSISDLVNKNIEKDKNLSKLAQIAVCENDLSKSMAFINQSIILNSKNDYSYWLRSYLYLTKKDFKNAILDFEKSKALKNSEDSKIFDELMIENIKMEMKKAK